MIVHDLNSKGIGFNPGGSRSATVINPNAALPPITGEYRARSDLFLNPSAAGCPLWAARPYHDLVGARTCLAPRGQERTTRSRH